MRISALAEDLHHHMDVVLFARHVKVYSYSIKYEAWPGHPVELRVGLLNEMKFDGGLAILYRQIFHRMSPKMVLRSEWCCLPETSQYIPTPPTEPGTKDGKR